MKRTGSSLVFVLLTMAVISVVLLVGSSALLSAARQRNALESSHVADEMQQSALQEGLMRLNQGVTEYGVGDSTGLTPRIRGFQTRTKVPCSAFVQDGSMGQYVSLPADDQNCPQYELTIRRFVYANSYSFQNQDVNPGGVNSVTLAIQGSTMITFTANFSVLQNFTFSEYSPVSGWSSPQTGVQFSTTSGITAVQLSNFTYLNGMPSDTTLVIKAEAPGNEIFTLDKGFTTIEATGDAADGTQTRTLTIVRPSGTVTTPTTEIFNSSGLCNPNPDTACR